MDARHERHSDPIEEQNGRRTPAQLPDMFETFPPLGEEGIDDDDKDEDGGEEEITIALLDYEQVFHSDNSSTRGVVICDSSQHNLTHTSGRWAMKASARHDRGKTDMMKDSKFESD
ncbi:hypothetical protein PVK06_039729 [Gossypium arboreum]|uniref:Uncharacterized protein n=1 Tax=Gossypium arboreum TaxID=29729 RepID=A0ABR0N3M9_GOSAR|nr:hypothetical protein PVK06_039729 [Gossypium arboreum]